MKIRDTQKLTEDVRSLATGLETTLFVVNKIRNHLPTLPTDDIRLTPEAKTALAHVNKLHAQLVSAQPSLAKLLAELASQES